MLPNPRLRPVRRQGQRKLCMTSATEIRRLYFGRLRKQRELALEFNVSQSVISRVVSGQIWGSCT